MFKRLSLVPIALAVALAACSDHASKARSKGALTVVPLGQPIQVAGLSFAPPADWPRGADRPMRVATLHPPAATGAADEAECGVFYFGKGEGGAIRANLDRWLGQLRTAEGQPKARFDREEELVVDGVRIHEADVSGTFLWTPGPISPEATPKPDWRLLGAVIEAPEGLVFVKLTGPAATVAKAQAGFEGMLRSIRPGQH